MLSTVYENIKILNSDYFIICIVRILKTREKTLMLLMFYQWYNFKGQETYLLHFTFVHELTHHIHTNIFS